MEGSYRIRQRKVKVGESRSTLKVEVATLKVEVLQLLLVASLKGTVSFNLGHHRRDGHDVTDQRRDGPDVIGAGNTVDPGFTSS